MEIEDSPVGAIVFGLVTTTTLAGLAVAADSPLTSACLLAASGVGGIPVGLGLGRLCADAGTSRAPAAAGEAASCHADRLRLGRAERAAARQGR